MDLTDLNTNKDRDGGGPWWLILIFLALIPVIFWLDVKWKVEGGPYHCSSLEEADAIGASLGRVSNPVRVDLRSATADAEIWAEHEYRYVRTGLFTALKVPDGEVYIHITFIGNAIMREHMRSVVSFYIDNRNAELLFTSQGSLLRVGAKNLDREHALEIRDEDTVLCRLPFRLQG